MPSAARCVYILRRSASRATGRIRPPRASPGAGRHRRRAADGPGRRGSAGRRAVVQDGHRHGRPLPVRRVRLRCGCAQRPRGVLGLHRRDAPLRSALRGADGQRQAVHRPSYPTSARRGAVRGRLPGERHHAAADQAPLAPTIVRTECFHRTLREEFLDHVVPFESLAAAREATDGWVHAYNHQSPDQALTMATPVSLFRPHAPVRQDGERPEQAVT